LEVTAAATVEAAEGLLDTAGSKQTGGRAVIELTVAVAVAVELLTPLVVPTEAEPVVEGARYWVSGVAWSGGRQAAIVVPAVARSVGLAVR
jgi:hypothetical protein